MTAALDVIDDSDALEAARKAVDGPDLKYPVETWFARGEAPDEIVRVAKEVGCDLIVMGTHGRTGLGRLLLGNTAESVLPEASCPVIILKSPKQATPTNSSSPPDKKVVTVF
jgi:nucleotide-binding universal stress UspA family protein